MFKILSLDGGGSWAIIQLLALKDRYGNVNGHQILKDFDLVIANSGGSIVLAALAENWNLDKALSLFQTREIRERIFSLNSFKDRFFPVDYLKLFGINIGPRYSAKRKMETFCDLFPGINKIQMSELPEFIGKKSLKIVVCTYDALNNREKFFRSYNAESDDFDSVRLTQAIHGSSNAPIQYFDFPARFKADKSGIFYELWDGALGGFNNPVLAGIIEAHKEGVSVNEIRVVSIGTGNKLMSERAKEEFWNLEHTTIRYRRKKLALSKILPQAKFFKEIVLNQAKTILYQPPDWANYVAMMFLKNKSDSEVKEQFIRLSPLIHIDSSVKEEVKELINFLYGMDMDLTKDSEIDKLKECFEEWKKGNILNQPIDFQVKRNNDIVCKSGDRYYQNAMDRWKSMKTLLLFTITSLLVSCGITEKDPGHFTSATDTLIIRTEKRKGDGLFMAGISPCEFRDTSDEFAGPVIYPKQVTDIRRMQIAADFRTLTPGYIELIKGRLKGNEIFILDENNNKDLNDDPVHNYNGVNWNSDSDLVRCRYTISNGQRIVPDSSWIRIGSIHGDLWWGRSEHLVAKFTLDKEKYELAVIDRMILGFFYDVNSEIAIQCHNEEIKDTLAESEILKTGEFLNLNGLYYRFDNITNNGEYITLIKEKNFDKKVGLQVGMIAPGFTCFTVSGDTLRSAALHDKLLVIANSCGCGGDEVSAQAYYDMRKEFPGIHVIRLDSDISKGAEGFQVDISENINNDIYNKYRNTYCSRMCYVIGTNNRIVDKFPVSEWKSETIIRHFRLLM